MPEGAALNASRPRGAPPRPPAPAPAPNRPPEQYGSLYNRQLLHREVYGWVPNELGVEQSPQTLARMLDPTGQPQPRGPPSMALRCSGRIYPPGASPPDLQRQLPPGASPLDLQRQIPPPVPGQGGPSPPLPQGSPIGGSPMIDFARMPPPAPVATGPSPAPLSRALYARGAASSVGCGGRAAAAQAAAGVASSDTPQSATSRVVGSSPASATAGTLSGAENTAESTQRSLADAATPAAASGDELILLADIASAGGSARRAAPAIRPVSDGSLGAAASI